MTVRRTLGAALVPVLLVGLTACGDKDTDQDKTSSATSSVSPGTDDSAEPVPSETTDADDGTFEGNDAEGEDTPEAGTTIPLETLTAIMDEGLANMTTANVTTTVEVSGMKMEMKGQVDYQAKPAAMKINLKMPTTDKTIEMLSVGGKMYMGSGDGKYVEMDASALGGTDLTQQMDASKSLQQFEPGITSITYVGDEKKVGTDARHYLIAIDTAKIDSLKAVPGMTSSIDYNVWFDSKNRMVAMEMKMGTMGTTSMEMADWGTPVDITAPDPSKVTKAPAGTDPLTGLLGG